MPLSAASFARSVLSLVIVDLFRDQNGQIPEGVTHVDARVLDTLVDLAQRCSFLSPCSLFVPDAHFLLYIHHLFVSSPNFFSLSPRKTGCSIFSKPPPLPFP